MLHKIYGGAENGDDQWRRRMNGELVIMYDHPSLTQRARAQRARMAGVRAENEKTDICEQGAFRNRKEERKDRKNKV